MQKDVMAILAVCGIFIGTMTLSSVRETSYKKDIKKVAVETATNTYDIESDYAGKLYDEHPEIFKEARGKITFTDYMIGKVSEPAGGTASNMLLDIIVEDARTRGGDLIPRVVGTYGGTSENTAVKLPEGNNADIYEQEDYILW